MIVLYWLWQIGSFLLRLIPLPVGYFLARLVGDLAYLGMPLRRHTAKQNFAQVLGAPPDDRKVRRVARASFRNFACMVMEVMRYPHRGIEEIERQVSLHLETHFHDALKMGKGLILVSAHYGNMDLVGAVLASRLAPLTIAADAFMRPKQLLDKLVEYRAAHRIRFVFLEQAPRGVLKALRQNELVGLLLDMGAQDEDAVPVTFFGAPTRFPAGAALLARRTGAPIVPGFTVVDDKHHVHAYATAPIIVTPSEDKAKDVQECMQRIANVFESFIRQYPEQWYMFRPMWPDD